MIKDLKRLLRVFTFDDINDTVTIGKPAIFSSTISLPDISVEVGDLALASAKLIVGNAAGKAAAVSAGGDVTCDNTGAFTIDADKVTYAKIQNVEAESVVANATAGATNPTGVALAEGQVLARATGGHVASQTVATEMITAKAVTPAKTQDIPVGLNYGVPDTIVADRFVASANMKVGTYTIANASPVDGLAHNVSVTHTAVGTVDTLGTITVDGTDVNDAVIQEVITPSNGIAVYGTKAFKSVTAVTGADWVIDGVEATEDTITVGFGGIIGLPLVLAAAADLVMATHGTGVLNAPTVAVGATIEACTIDLSTAGDGSKRLRLFYQN